MWGQLTTYQQLHYLEVVKHDMKLGKKMQWQEDHQGLMKAKRALSYVVNLEFLDPIYEKLGNLSSGNTTIEKKDSPSIAARDIRRILNPSGSYSDGVNGTCKYYIRNISADKYSRIVIDVEMINYSLSDVGSLSSLKLNLKEEIREAAYTESGGYTLAVTVY